MIVINSMISMLNRGNKIQIQRNPKIRNYHPIHD